MLSTRAGAGHVSCFTEGWIGLPWGGWYRLSLSCVSLTAGPAACPPTSTAGSESEPASPQLFSEKGRTTKDSPDRIRGVGRTRRPDKVTFRGQYTGGPEGKAEVGIVPRVVSSVVGSFFHLAIPISPFSMNSVIWKTSGSIASESQSIYSFIHSSSTQFLMPLLCQGPGLFLGKLIQLVIKRFMKRLLFAGPGLQGEHRITYSWPTFRSDSPRGLSVLGTRHPAHSES